MRYSELKRTLMGINDKMLSQVLKELEERGVINRQVFNSTPLKVTYDLTDEGKKLVPIMQAMSDYGAKFEV